MVSFSGPSVTKGWLLLLLLLGSQGRTWAKLRKSSMLLQVKSGCIAHQEAGLRISVKEIKDRCLFLTGLLRLSLAVCNCGGGIRSE